MKFLPFVTMLVVLLVPALAHADETPEDLLRKARTAETVERDLESAQNLLMTITRLDQDDRISAEAHLMLARIYELVSRKSQALDVLRTLTSRYTKFLNEAEKRAVHDAMVRLLPPGSRDRSPLGDIYVVAPHATTSRESPLEEKIRALFVAYERTKHTTQNAQARARIASALTALGAEAFPVLERMVQESNQGVAEHAAQVYARYGGAAAMRALLRILREGDGFARAAAVMGLQSLTPGKEVSGPFVAELDRMRKEEFEFPGFYPLKLIARHIDTEEALRRHRTDSENSLYWLRIALGHKSPEAMHAALELALKGTAERDEVLPIIFDYVYPKSPYTAQYPPDSLDTESVVALLDALLAAPPAKDDMRKLNAIHGLLRIVTSGEDAALTERMVRKAYALLEKMDDGRARRTYQRLVLKRPIPRPAYLFEDAEFASMLFRNWSPSFIPGTLVKDDRFWHAFLASLPKLKPYQGAAVNIAIHHALRNARISTSPAKFDKDVVAFLRAYPVEPDSKLGVPLYLIKAAARTEAFPELIRKHVVGSHWSQRAWNQWFEHGLAAYKGDDRLALIEELARAAPKGKGAYPLDQLFAGIEGSEMVRIREGGLDLLIRLARDAQLPAAAEAIAILEFKEEWTGVGSQKALMLELIERATTGALPPPRYRRALRDVAHESTLREAVPFLLRLYRAGDPEAESILEDIRAYHDRLESFEAWARGDGKSQVKELEGLLDDKDAEIRRAAVLALGALSAKESLPKLVKLLKSESDARVRAAVVQAIERMSETKR